MLPVRDACAEKSLQKKSSNINTESNTAGSHYAGETQVSASLTSECLSMPVYSLLITPQGINSACLTENAFSAHSLCLVSFFLFGTAASAMWVWLSGPPHLKPWKCQSNRPRGPEVTTRTLRNRTGWNETQPPCLFEPCVENSMGFQGRVLTRGVVGGWGRCNVFPSCQQTRLSPGKFFAISRGRFVFCFFAKTECHMWREVAGAAGKQWKQKLIFCKRMWKIHPQIKLKGYLECFFSTTTKHFVFNSKSMHVLNTVTWFHKNAVVLFAVISYLWTNLTLKNVFLTAKPSHDD